jgi:galactose mutarotase-like enzyme
LARDLADAEENVVIRKGDCVVTLMPAFGGKIASLRVASAELLQAPLKPLAPRTQTMPFSESDASGWDECLPSVAGCTVETEAGPATVPDHGDLWRLPWQVLTASEDSATLRVQGFSLPLQLTRSILLAESATGWRLELLYSLTNMGAYRVPWSWSAHPLFAVDPGDRVVLPNEIQILRLEGSRCNRLGATGDSVSWPLASSKDQNKVDLSHIPCSDSRIGDKLFAGPFGPTQPTWCALERVRLNLRLTMRFEPSLTPYLGLWLCYGGWPEEPGAKQFCVAVEPATAPVDSLEKAGPWSRWLESGETCNWPIELLIDRFAQNTYEAADPSPERSEPAS